MITILTFVVRNCDGDNGSSVVTKTLGEDLVKGASCLDTSIVILSFGSPTSPGESWFLLPCNPSF